MFIHFLWRQLCFDLKELKTTQGQLIRLDKTGYGNADAGPDFLDARIWIGETLWAGNVEIHVLSSEWYLHKHQDDPAYDNVILHVVLTEDRPVISRIGWRIPCLVLEDRIPKEALRMYHRWMNSRHWVACQSGLADFPTLRLNLWLDRLLVERLEDRVGGMSRLLEKHTGNWERVFMISMFRGFGLKVNADAMEMLAESIPDKLLDRIRDRPFELEAILLGQSGLIPENPEDSYSSKLSESYQFLAYKHKLKAISRVVWKFSRLRPSAFPAVRIARLAAMINQYPHWMRTVLEMRSPSDFFDFLQVELSPYWQKHFRFGQFSEKADTNPGKEWAKVLVLNVVIPFLFLYGRQTGQEQMVNKALSWMDQLPAEDNRVIRSWKSLIDVQTAGQGQAAIHLWKNYCQKKRCLECRIGQHLIGDQARGSGFAKRHQAGKQKGRE